MPAAGEPYPPDQFAQRRFDFGDQMTASAGRPGQTQAPGEPGQARRTMTIGAVCKALEAEFADISISKIRYLEDQQLLTPKRTPGGYRQYTAQDVERLRTILRLQRDEFLPLRVIRQELEGGGDPAALHPPSEARAKVRSIQDQGTGGAYTAAQLAATLDAEPQLINELVEYGVIEGELRDGERLFNDNDLEILRATSELARYGVGPRNLRIFRTSAEREATLIQSILGASLSSRNPERRQQALAAVDELADACGRLRWLLLIQDLRKIVP